MPTYQYECDVCDHSFDILQSMLDKKLKKCPQCGKNRLHRLIGAGSGIIFKGSGFYETDYKKKEATDSKKAASTEEKPAKETKSKADKSKASGSKKATQKTNQVA